MTDARRYRTRETLRDGTPVTVRAISPDDRHMVLTAFQELDPESVYTRYFTYKKALTDDELSRTTEVDFDNVVALVVIAGEGDAAQLMGGGRYAINDNGKHPPESAEVAFITCDTNRGRGVASLLLGHLVRIAREQNLAQFEAQVLRQNQAMLGVFRRSGLAMTQTLAGDVINITLSLAGGSPPAE